MTAPTFIQNDPTVGERRVVAVDLFCGVGGLTHGLLNEGIEVVAGYDLEGDCRYAYETNNPGAAFFERDITTLTAAELAAHYPDGSFRVLVGCAPCQPYSSAAAKTKRGLADAELETEWRPLRKFLELILELKPDMVSMENVVRLATPGKFPIYREFKEALTNAGYRVSEYRIFGPDYGIPQARRRLVLFASLSGDVAIPPKTYIPADYPTIHAALNGLRPLANGEADPDDPLHKAWLLGDRNLERAKASLPGGTWADWPEELRLECHKRPSGSTYGSVYGRIEPNAPAPTMTTQFYNIGTGRFVHPTQHRGLSLREGAILQTFPSDYAFVRPGDEIRFTRQGRQIGNAVPPVLGRVIGRAVLAHVGRADLAAPLSTVESAPAPATAAD